MKSSSTFGRVAAISVATALVAGSALLVGGAASAAGEVQVTAAEVRADEASYAGWHEGYAPPGAPATVTNAGLTMTGKSQIINGLAVPEKKTSFTDVSATLSATATADSAPYSLQLPVYTDSGDAATFNTIRSFGDAWEFSKDFGTALKDTPYTTLEVSTALGADFDVLAFGVAVPVGNTTTIETISFEGTTYRFNKVVVEVPPVAPSVTITPTTITPADFVDTTKGFTVNIVGFQPNEQVTVGLTLPDGTVVGFADGANVFTVGEDGTLVLPNLVLTGSGTPQLGIYTFSVTGEVTPVQTATITVANPVVPAVVTPEKAKLANTGLTDGPMFASAGLGLLLMGFAAFGITVVNRRRRNA